MCLLLIAVRAVPGKPLLLLGNRDEFRARASAAAAPWTEDQRIVGGRDLVAGGSWLALRSDGRHAAVTNVRSGLPATAPKSRGWLVRDFVLGDANPRDFLDALHADVESYGAFNLVVGDRDETWAYGTADYAPCKLDNGVHVISNGRIGVHWPKTERLQRRFTEVVASPTDSDDIRLLDLLADEQQPSDEALPDTGVGLELERLLAPVFVRGSALYGTRASTLAYLADSGATLREHSFPPDMRTESETHWSVDLRAQAWKSTLKHLGVAP
jgi:uncharacterized protein with NRDE domain